LEHASKVSDSIDGETAQIHCTPTRRIFLNKLRDVRALPASLYRRPYHHLQ